MENNQLKVKRKPRIRFLKLHHKEVIKQRRYYIHIDYAQQKWTKGRAKDKLNNAVFLDQASYKQIETQLPKMGALVTVSTVSDKFKVNGSLARRCIRHFTKSGLLVPVGDQNSKQYIFTVNAQVVAAQKAAAAAAAADKPQAQKKAPAKK